MKQRARIGQEGYVKAFSVIAHTPGGATESEVRIALGINRATSIRFCHCTHDLRLIHVASWDHSGRYLMPRYKLGDLPDAPHPTSKPRPRADKRADSSELILFASMVRALQSLPHHIVGLHRETGAAEATARIFIKAMRKAKLAYIAEFEDRGQSGAGYPLYGFGLNKRDAKKPEPVSQEEQQRRQNEMRAKRREQRRIVNALVKGYRDERSAPHRRVPPPKPQACGTRVAQQLEAA